MEAKDGWLLTMHKRHGNRIFYKDDERKVLFESEESAIICRNKFCDTECNRYEHCIHSITKVKLVNIGSEAFPNWGYVNTDYPIIK